MPLEVYARAQEFQQSTARLDQMLYDFMQDMSHRRTIREQRGLDMLRSRAKINRVLAGTCLHAEASALDAYQSHFEEILTLCNYRCCSEDLEGFLFSPSLDDGLVWPLLFVASACRDSRIRHQAHARLKSLPAKDGVWHVDILARLTEAEIRYEEALFEGDHPTCKDIPEWRRVHASALDKWDVSSGKTTVRVALRTRPNGMDGEWHDVLETLHLYVQTTLLQTSKLALLMNDTVRQRSTNVTYKTFTATLFLV